MISKKVDALGEEERRALEYASVEGQEFLSPVVAALLGVDEVDLEELLARIEKTHRLIVTRGEEELPDGSLATRYRFAHALYQNFLYGGLVTKRKIMLHRQAGEQLTRHYGKRAPQIATQLALHFERGRDFPHAVEFLMHAGDNATKLYANDEAAEHYTHALGLAKKLPEEVQPEIMSTLHGKRGATNMALSRFGESVDDYVRMLKHQEVLDSPEKKAGGLIAMATSLFFSHRLEEMEARADEALAAAKRAGSETLRLDTMGLMALKHAAYGELDLGRPILDEVIKSARAINYKPALLTGLTWRGCLYFFQTEYERAIECEHEARAIFFYVLPRLRLRIAMTDTGCGDEPFGNLTITVTPNGQVSVRLPKPLEHLANATHGRYVLSGTATFSYRADEWAARITGGQSVSYTITRTPGRAGRF